MKPELTKLFAYLKKDYEIIAPVKKTRGIFLSRINDPKKICFSAELTKNTFKEFLFPKKQTLFNFQGDKLIEPANSSYPKQAIFGISIIDLRALLVYEQVFRHDPYYQNYRNNSLIIGYLSLASTDQTFGIFEERLEEDTLEHLEFDVFALATPAGIHFFSGSSKGRQALIGAGFENFENIEYVGPVRESGLDPLMMANYKMVKNSFERHRLIWEELGRRCLACGKCSLVCPTCFCFASDQVFGQTKRTGRKTRRWDTCFYSEFSRVAGGHKFLDTIAKRIYFWYEHKFVRIPDEFSIPGCVGCGRCIAVCPVAIDLRQTLKDLAKPPKLLKQPAKK
ncbi:MAG: 4Fe-4S dicluster domain-containing protein [Patescibacteria group bacterium]|nr:4Fe-4S dicluster domain-containing protein [Patescibacteria group bacterium]